MATFSTYEVIELLESVKAKVINIPGIQPEIINGFDEKSISTEETIKRTIIYNRGIIKSINRIDTLINHLKGLK